jgi:hypothetical protein
MKKSRIFFNFQQIFYKICKFVELTILHQTQSILHQNFEKKTDSIKKRYKRLEALTA